MPSRYFTAYCPAGNRKNRLFFRGSRRSDSPTNCRGGSLCPPINLQFIALRQQFISLRQQFIPCGQQLIALRAIEKIVYFFAGADGATPQQKKGLPKKAVFFVEAPPRFELGIRVLQTRALPLGYGAIKKWSGLRDSLGSLSRSPTRTRAPR